MILPSLRGIRTYDPRPSNLDDDLILIFDRLILAVVSGFMVKKNCELICFAILSYLDDHQKFSFAINMRLEISGVNFYSLWSPVKKGSKDGYVILLFNILKAIICRSIKHKKLEKTLYDVSFQGHFLSRRSNVLLNSLDARSFLESILKPCVMTSDVKIHSKN